MYIVNGKMSKEYIHVHVHVRSVLFIYNKLLYMYQVHVYVLT